MAKRCRSQTAAGRGTRANCMRTRTEDAAAELGGEKKQLERKTMASSISTHPGAHENWLFFILLPSFRVPTSATAAVSLKRTVLIFFFFFLVARLYFTGWRWADQRSLRDSLPLSFPSLSFSFSLDCVNGLRVFSRPSSVVSRSCATAVDPAKAGVQFFPLF